MHVIGFVEILTCMIRQVAMEERDQQKALIRRSAELAKARAEVLRCFSGPWFFQTLMLRLSCYTCRRGLPVGNCKELEKNKWKCSDYMALLTGGEASNSHGNYVWCLVYVLSMSLELHLTIASAGLRRSYNPRKR